MSKPIEQLTDDVAAAIWSGDTASLANLETKVETPKEESTEVETDDNKTEEVVEVDDEAIARALRGEDDVDDTDDEPVDTSNKDSKGTITKPTSKGRKPTEPVKFVEDLVEDGTLFAFEGEEQVKTLDEAKELIKANLERVREEAAESAFEIKKKSYSPQVQTILDYAERGVGSATELMELIGAIKDVEDVNDLDPSTDEGAEAIVREAYKAKGFKDAYIEKNIKRLKDLDAIKEEAEELSPELAELKTKAVKRRLEDQARRQEEALEASKVYFKTIEDTLNQESIGGIKLAKEEKRNLYAALADNRYQSLSGQPTNMFIRTLEELQFGKNSNYDHFLNIVQHAIDPKGFTEKLKASIKEEVTADTVRRLKTAKTNTANAEETTNEAPKKTVKRTGFVNPF